MLLKKQPTVNPILIDAGFAYRVRREGEKMKWKNEAIFRGTPSVCLSFGVILEVRKKQARAKNILKEEKERPKQERVESRARKATLNEQENIACLRERAEQVSACEQ